TMSTQQRQMVMDDQLRRVHQELRSRRAAIRQDPPAWVEHLPPQDHPGYEDALNKVLLWRAVADYDQAGQPLGPEPSQNMSKSLRAYYQQAHRLSPLLPPTTRTNKLMRNWWPSIQTR